MADFDDFQINVVEILKKKIYDGIHSKSCLIYVEITFRNVISFKCACKHSANFATFHSQNPLSRAEHVLLSKALYFK